MGALTVVAPRDAAPRCPACARPLADGPFRVIGAAGTVVLPIRCGRHTCRAVVEVVCHVAERRRQVALRDVASGE